MQLSEAIRLGSLTIENPKRGDWATCALGMAAKACGFRGKDARGTAEFVKHTWPWTNSWKRSECPVCNGETFGTERIWHVFDHHVCSGEMTLEQLVDWIRTIEPESLPTSNNAVLCLQQKSPKSPNGDFERILQVLVT